MDPTSEIKKSIQDLEKEKLEIEIELLKHNIEKEKNELRRSKNPGEVIRKNITVILTIISVSGGILGIVIPVNNFFKEKRQERIPSLNNEIIKLVSDLNNSNSEKGQEDATIMLTYYGINAIPVLLSKLDRAKDIPESERLLYAIEKIHEECGSQVTDKIYGSLKDHFNEDYKKNDIDETGARNEVYSRYVDLLRNLNLSKKEKRGLLNLLKYIDSNIQKCGDSRFMNYLIRELEPLYKILSIVPNPIKNNS